MPRLLTVRKEKWRNNFKPSILRGDAISPSASVAIRYQARLEQLISEMLEDVRKEIIRLFSSEGSHEYFETMPTHDASVASQARIVTNMLNKKYTQLFGGKSKILADYFAKQSDSASSKSVHLSIKKLSGGLSLPTAALSGDLTEIFKATVAENVSLIKSIPQKYLGQVEQAVMRSITTGEGLKTLVPFLKKQENITYARAKMIAHDQTRKAFQNMSAERVQRLGVKKFEWVHVPSNHPRPLHKDVLNGKVYAYDKLPIIDKKTGERGLPGQLINCRCMQRPVIEFED